MSEKEKALIQKIAQLPPELQEKMSTQMDGVVMALDFLERRKEETK